MQIKTNKVKEIVIRSSNFTHIPLPGLEIRNADKLSISNSYFHRISAGSVTVKSAKEVEVINNNTMDNPMARMLSNIDIAALLHTVGDAVEKYSSKD